MNHNNKKLFSAVKELNLSLGQYAITGSGPLGIRNLREINDIDIIVMEELWKELSKKYEVVDKNGVIKIVIPTHKIEIFYEGSFYSYKKTKEDPSVLDRIRKAEIIDSLSFESLEHVLYYKLKMKREKDLKDIEIINKLLA